MSQQDMAMIPNSQPTKRIKLDLEHSIQQQKQKQQQNNSQLNSQNINKIFCKCYTRHQIDSIISALFALQSYTKIISVMIRHQQKSIKTLPKELLKMKQFSQLGERVNKCILRARINNDFLNKVTRNYSSYLQQTIKSNIDINKTSDIAPNQIVGIFVQVVKQWSEFSKTTKRPIYEVIQLIKKYSPLYADPISVQRSRIFVQGSGMGRILCQLEYSLNPKPLQIQSCQDRVLYYIMSQYFIGKRPFAGIRQKIHPFIHNFTNCYKTDDPYQQIQVPQWPYPPLPSSVPIYTHLGDFEQDYISNEHNNQWNIFVSYLYNNRIKNLLKWIQLVYKGLTQGGIWIITCYASFQSHITVLGFQEFYQILSNTQFKILAAYDKMEEIVIDRGMTKQKLKIHYIVLQK